MTKRVSDYFDQKCFGLGCTMLTTLHSAVLKKPINWEVNGCNGCTICNTCKCPSGCTMFAGRCPLPAGHWPLALGRWPLAACRWSLAAGRWPLAAAPSTVLQKPLPPPLFSRNYFQRQEAQTNQRDQLIILTAIPASSPGWAPKPINHFYNDSCQFAGLAPETD